MLAPIRGKAPVSGITPLGSQVGRRKRSRQDSPETGDEDRPDAKHGRPTEIAKSETAATGPEPKAPVTKTGQRIDIRI